MLSAAGQETGKPYPGIVEGQHIDPEADMLVDLIEDTLKEEIQYYQT